MSKQHRFLVLALLVFASVDTVLLVLWMMSPGMPALPGTKPQTSPLQLAILSLESQSRVTAPLGWAMVIGVWAWKGKTRSRWSSLGFEYGTFRMLARMRGGKTRMRMLRSLETPKDRLQLANELDLDWKTIDGHVRVLLRNGMIQERTARGHVKVYELTSTGIQALGLMEEEPVVPALGRTDV